LDPFKRLKLAYAYFNTRGFVDFYAVQRRYAFLKRMEARYGRR
jgi:hypothetical protein